MPPKKFRIDSVAVIPIFEKSIETINYRLIGTLLSDSTSCVVGGNHYIEQKGYDKYSARRAKGDTIAVVQSAQGRGVYVSNGKRQKLLRDMAVCVLVIVLGMLYLFRVKLFFKESSSYP